MSRTEDAPPPRWPPSLVAVLVVTAALVVAVLAVALWFWSSMTPFEVLQN